MEDGIAAEFNKILYKEIFTSISKAFVSLNYDLLYCDKESSENLIAEKAEEMKNKALKYIDEQRALFEKIINKEIKQA